MGFLLNGLQFFMTSSCLLGVCLIFALLWATLRNLPELLRLGRAILRETLIWSYQLYRPLMVRLQPLAAEYLRIDLGRMPCRILFTGALSVLCLLGLDLLLHWRPSVETSAVAFVHGTLVALLWDEFDRTDGIQTGERIQ